MALAESSSGCARAGDFAMALSQNEEARVVKPRLLLSNGDVYWRQNRKPKVG
jgi:hypothetical protein